MLLEHRLGERIDLASRNTAQLLAQAFDGDPIAADGEDVMDEGIGDYRLPHRVVGNDEALVVPVRREVAGASNSG
jgi:hypothetical protein